MSAKHWSAPNLVLKLTHKTVYCRKVKRNEVTAINLVRGGLREVSSRQKKVLSLLAITKKAYTHQLFENYILQIINNVYYCAIK